MEPLQPGDPTVLGRYSIIGRLGVGGMGWVFLGRTPGGRNVAVKAVRPEFARDPEFRERFRHEVAAARSVSGRYTAAVVDADPDAATPWLATIYIPGMSLRAVVDDGWRLPEDSLAALAGGLAEALAEIHRARLIHRDLKPSNVMVAVDGPRVIDFGISRAAGGGGDLTRTGIVVGSPGFMSPEQILGQGLTPASDVFSLGSVLAYAATGHNPFGEGPEQALLFRVAHGEPELRDVPPTLARLVAACLAKDPWARPTPQEIIGRTAAPPTGTWLPAALTAAIARSATEILDFEGVDTGSSTLRFEDPDTRVMPPPTATRRISRERVAEPVMSAAAASAPRRKSKAAIVVGVTALAAVGAAITAASLSGNQTEGPTQPVTVTQVSTIPAPSSSSSRTATRNPTTSGTAAGTSAATSAGQTASNPGAPTAAPTSQATSQSATIPPPTSAAGTSSQAAASSSAPPSSSAPTEAPTKAAPPSSAAATSP